MLRIARRLAIAMILVAVAGAAQAHRPYLAGGHLALYMGGCCEPTELRLLYGDGIIGSDPVRPIVVGAQGQVYALGPKSDAAAIACNGSQCRIFIYRADDVLPRVLVPDKSNFMVRDPVHRVDDDDAIAATERAEQSYGFVTLPLGPLLLAQGAWAFIAQSPLAAMLLVAVSLGVWPTCRLAFTGLRARTPGRRARLAAAAVACGLATFALWGFAWIALGFVTGFPVPVAVLITVLAALVMLSWTAFARRRRRRPAAA